MYKLLLPILLLLGVIGVAALSDRPQPRADFTFINSGNVSTLDTAILSWMQDIRVARMISEGLVTKDIFSWGYDTKPAAAERWEVSPDAKTYTFHLRKDGVFSNGDPLTSRDFIYAWRRVMTPDLAADYVKFFDKVEGMNAYYDWRNAALRDYTTRARSIPTADRPAAARELWQQTLKKFDELVGVRAPDDHTIIITLEKPVPYFLDLVAFPTFFPVHEKSVRLYERLDPDTGRIKWDQGWTKPPNLITNGPMTLTSWRFMRDMRFEKNQRYWNKDAIAINSIGIPSVDDANARVLAFDSGAVDWVSDVMAPYRGDIVRQKLEFYRENKAEYDSLKAQGLDPIEIDRRLPPDPRNRISVLPAFGTYFYNFNCLPRLPDGRPNPFADARVRRAFALAIDKEAIVTNVRRTGEPVADTLIPRNSIPGYTSPVGLRFNPELARKTLAEAGFPTGKDFPVAVEILFNKDAGHDLIAQAIAKNWEQHLGVSVILQQKEIKVFREDLKGGGFMTSRAGWFGDYGDPTTFLYLSYASKDDAGQIIYDGNNDRKYFNPAFTMLLDRAADETDPAKRLALLGEAERILVEEDFPMVPIFHYAQIYQFDPHRITGISSHPRQEQLLHWVDMLGDGKGPEKIKALPPRTAEPLVSPPTHQPNP